MKGCIACVDPFTELEELTRGCVNSVVDISLLTFFCYLVPFGVLVHFAVMMTSTEVSECVFEGWFYEQTVILGCFVLITCLLSSATWFPLLCLFTLS